MGSEVADVHGARRLRGVAVKQDAAGRQHLGEPWDVLNGADLVVDRHNADNEHRFIEMLCQRGQIDEPCPIHRDSLYLKPFMIRQRPGRRQDTFVLDGTDEDAPPTTRGAPRQTQ